jgi:penicillin-binding protein 1C
VGQVLRFIRSALHCGKARVRALVGVVLTPVIALIVAAALTPLPPELAAERYSSSVRFLDREGALLREVRADDATRARWVSVDEIGQLPTMAVLAAEDRRFYDHPGIDPIAIARAAALDLAHGRVVSGASTLTMQLARLLRPRKRDLRGKFAQMALALRIEASLTKRDILEQYVNRAPFGPDVRGIDSASRFYFDKPPSQLSLAEAATLAGIPRGPAVYALQKHPERALRRRDRILDRMLEAGWISRDAHDRAKAEPLALRAAKGSFGAPHFVAAVASGSLTASTTLNVRGAQTVTTTLDRELQRESETAAAVTVQSLARRHATAASVVVLDNASGEVLAYVGSPDWGDAGHGGQNDGVRAARQPGSTLKPFVYGLAIEQLGFTAATTLPDVELHLEVESGVYAPNNYDERFHGPVRLREALGNSLNVPAVWTAEQLGASALLERLHRLGFASLGGAPESYGPGLALGDGEVTLLELANAYATIARGGLWKPVVAVRNAQTKDGATTTAVAVFDRRVMPLEVARTLADILHDDRARAASFGEGSVLDFPFDVAAKTGTSKGYRDNWTVGFTHEVTVAVWVGNFDGSPMQDVSGITGAGPLFRSVMSAAMQDRPQTPLALGASTDDLVSVEVCPLSGGAPTSACPHAVREWLPRSRAALAPCSMHERLTVDRRNGLLAGRGCPPAFVELRTFEHFDPEYAAWAKSAGRDGPPTAFSPLCAGPVDGVVIAPLRIGYPRDGARYRIDPGRPLQQQTLSLRIEAQSNVPRVALRVDGAVTANVAPPYVFNWQLSPGEHVLTAEAKGLPASPPVHVVVE